MSSLITGRRRVLPLYIPPATCAPDCYFCHPTAGRPPEEDLDPRELLRSRLASLGASAQPVEIAFYGGMLDLSLEIQAALLDLACGATLEGKAQGIRVSLRPDQVSSEALERLKAAGAQLVELELPTLAEGPLRSLGPAHAPQAVQNAVGLLRDAGFTTGFHLRPGLPGSHPAAELGSLEHILALRPAFVRLCPVLVLRGTWLELLLHEGRYHCLNMEETIALCGRMLERLEAAGVPVVRLGLQPVQDLGVEPGAVVAGPYHPSLRLLVEAERMYARAQDLFSQVIPLDGKAKLWVGPGSEQSLRGPENQNLVRLKARFRLRSVGVRVDEGMPRGQLRLELSGSKEGTEGPEGQTGMGLRVVK